jgi:hypothetical protein
MSRVITPAYRWVDCNACGGAWYTAGDSREANMADRSERIPTDMPEFDAAMRQLVKAGKGTKVKRTKAKKRKS